MLNVEKIREMKIFSKRVQMEVVKMIAGLGIGHLGGSLSITDHLSIRKIPGGRTGTGLFCPRDTRGRLCIPRSP